MRQTKILLWLTIAVFLFISPLHAWMLFDVTIPDSGLMGHSFIEITHYDGIIWVASGSGVSASDDGGLTWVTYTDESGLNSNSPSALFARSGQIWVAGSHTEYYEGLGYPFGDAFNISFDNNIYDMNWISSIPEDSSGYGYAKLAYDMAGDDSATYAATFYSGLLVTHDYGETWDHMFFSQADSLDWAADLWADLEIGRYYSCAVDTFHVDTTIVIGGTAGGIAKFYYLPRKVKLGGAEFYDFELVDSTLYIAHEGGVTRTVDSSYSRFFTSDTLNGLEFNWVKKIFYYGDKLWAGVFNPDDSSGAGLYYSTDSAESWQKLPVDFFDGSGSGVYDVNFEHDSVLYIAAGDSGLFRTVDTGLTWSRIYVDAGYPDQTSPRNQVYSLDITMDGLSYLDDTLYLGTKAGLIKAAYNEAFGINSVELVEFPESDSTGSFVRLVRHQNQIIDSTGAFTWVGLEPQIDGDYAAVIIDSMDKKVVVFEGFAVNDIAVTPDITLLATDVGFYYNANIADRAYTEKDTVVDFGTGLVMSTNQFHSVEIMGDRLYAGSNNGGGLRVGFKNWLLIRANVDPHKHDLGVSHTFENSGLPGDWVVALEVQKYEDDIVYWAGCRRVIVEDEEEPQATALGFSTDLGASWTSVLSGKQIWNIDFDSNGVVYAAASEGLYYALPPWTNWTRANIIDDVVQDTIVESSKIYSVEVIDSMLWVGTSLGLAVRHIHDVIGWQDNDWDILRVYKDLEADDEVYAAPVPYSPINNNGRLTVHYRVENSADVTVEIFDFAMNRVRILAEDKPRSGGGEYFESWDGYNGRGDMVATGIYFIKVSMSTGETYWGRLAIIP